jgi:uncharacterized Tic20 family protein
MTTLEAVFFLLVGMLIGPFTAWGLYKLTAREGR